MITEPRIDRASLLAEQQLRDHIESFEKRFLDYRYEEVEDGTQTSDTAQQVQADIPENAAPQNI